MGMVMGDVLGGSVNGRFHSGGWGGDGGDDNGDDKEEDEFGPILKFEEVMKETKDSQIFFSSLLMFLELLHFGWWCNVIVYMLWI